MKVSTLYPNVYSPIDCNGNYDFYPHPRGRGYSPRYLARYERLDGDPRVVHFVFNSGNHARWGRSEFMAQCSAQLAQFEHVRGRLQARAYAYKPHPHWAYENYDEHFVFIGTTVTDAIMFKLSMETFEEGGVIEFLK